MFLKVKRDRRVKGLTCADTRKQRKKAVPGDADPPKVSTESILLTATIDAQEEIKSGICDILGDFLSADMDKDVNMALRGRLSEMMVKLHPRYTDSM